MKISTPVVLLLVLVLVVSLASCSKKPAPIDETPFELPPLPSDEPVVETPTAEAATPEAIVEQVGAPLFEGAETEGAAAEEGKTVATFWTDASYRDVKAFYMEKLEAPDWSNNGFELGIMGGDEWEFKSSDEKHLVTVSSEGSGAKTRILFTIEE
ncbi:MAG: hypothetical protein GX358_06130 [candidate division WS1 bacterium]|jgi:hypothetical protein|nr:hypothetical protein [candidate division WS1 bacterium]